MISKALPFAAAHRSCPRHSRVETARHALNPKYACVFRHGGRIVAEIDRTFLKNPDQLSDVLDEIESLKNQHVDYVKIYILNQEPELRAIDEKRGNLDVTFAAVHYCETVPSEDLDVAIHEILDKAAKLDAPDRKG